ncbi:Uncharacterised protein [Chlamydia trachomatis]|nr:Uncharacterised protein [Chlamydia trachomatis]
MSGKELIELVAVEVSAVNERPALGQRVEGIASGEQEGDGPDGVGLRLVQWLTVNGNRGDAFAEGTLRVVRVPNILGEPELEQRAGILGVEIGLPLLFEGELEVSAGNGHISELVREGHDRVRLGVGDGAVIIRDEVLTQTTRVDDTDIDGTPLLRRDRLAHRVGHEVPEARLDAAVGSRIGLSARGREDAPSERLRITGTDDPLASLLRIRDRLVYNGLGIRILAALGDLRRRHKLGISLDDGPCCHVIRDADESKIVGVRARRNASK